MPLILPGNVASATAAAGYDVANSCRFDGSSAYLSKTFTEGNRKTFTWSGWVKLGEVNATTSLFSARSSTSDAIRISLPSQALEFWSEDAGVVSLSTSRFFRDPTGWYNIVVAVDTTQGTAANRVKIYINGTQETSFNASTYPAEDYEFANLNNSVAHSIGQDNSAQYFDGYMAEVVFIDGLQLAASSFGEFDSDSPTIWKPKDVSGLTFGDEGFYLDFEDSGDLGDDESGNTNDFTENNIAAADQSVDTCTNNFCTLNPLLKGSYITLSEGNLVSTGNTSTDAGNVACTFPMPGGGKWYFELKITAISASGYPKIAVFHDFQSVPQGNYNGGAGGDNMHPSGASGDAVSTTIQYNSTTLENPTENLSITAPANGDIIQFALDMDNGAIYVGVNGTFLNSGDPTSGASKTGKVADLTVTNQIMPMVCDYNGSATSWNFGSPHHSISSGNADDNGYGNFEYDVPTGYLALCTKNLGSDGG